MNITVDGIDTSFNDTGSGKLVVLLHGWGSNKENLLQLQEFLAKNYRVVSLDMPGFGQTSMPPLNWAVGDYVEFVKKFLLAINAEQTYALVGHSFGGRVCIKGLGSHTLAASKLVLIGSAGIKHSASPKNVLIASVAKLGKFIFKLPIVNRFYGRAQKSLHEKVGSDDYASAGQMQQIFLNTIREDLQKAAGNISTPSLLIWGSEDLEVPIADARKFEELIAGSQLKIIQGAGHFVHNDYPEKVQKWIAEFLS